MLHCPRHTVQSCRASAERSLRQTSPGHYACRGLLANGIHRSSFRPALTPKQRLGHPSQSSHQVNTLRTSAERSITSAAVEEALLQSPAPETPLNGVHSRISPSQEHGQPPTQGEELSLAAYAEAAIDEEDHGSHTQGTSPQTKSSGLAGSPYDRHTLSEQLLRHSKSKTKHVRSYYNVSTTWPDPSVIARFSARASLRDLRKTWRDLDRDIRRKEWPHLLLWHMESRPDEVPTFLMATLLYRPVEQVPFDLIIDFLVTRFRLNALSAGGLSYSKFVYQIKKTLRAARLAQRYHDFFRPTQKLLSLLVKHADTWQILLLKSMVMRRGIVLEAHVKFNFAYALARHRRHGLALDMLVRAIQARDPSTGPAMSMVTSTLIREAAREREKTAYRMIDRIVKALQRLSVKPTTMIYNMLLLTAARSRHNKAESWRLFSVILKTEEGPNNRTFLHLLTLCRIDSLEERFRSLQRRLTAMRRHKLIEPDSDVVRELILGSYEFTKKGNFYGTLHVYAEHFSMQPLVQLRLISKAYADQMDLFYCDRTVRPQPLPSHAVVEVMLYIWVRCSQDLLPAIHLYRTFKKQIACHNPLFVAMASREYSWMQFIAYFCVRGKLLEAWSTILRDMMQPLSDASPSQVQQSSEAPEEAAFALSGWTHNVLQISHGTPRRSLATPNPPHTWPAVGPPPIWRLIKRLCPERFQYLPSAKFEDDPAAVAEQKGALQSTAAQPTTDSSAVEAAPQRTGSDSSGASESTQMPINPITGEPLQPCQPGRGIWHYLLAGFARAGQPTAAEKVAERMRSQGLPITERTWDELLKGYAQANQIEGLAEAIKKREENRVPWTERAEETMKRFTKDQRVMRGFEEEGSGRKMSHYARAKMSRDYLAKKRKRTIAAKERGLSLFKRPDGQGFFEIKRDH